ncbi:hypothetical protein ACKI2N_020385 [Cupriavidus sp. 30B13]
MRTLTESKNSGIGGGRARLRRGAATVVREAADAPSLRMSITGPDF